MLNGKKIILGVSGSIAAYKAATLTRLMVKAGAEVRILMTPAAMEFITPLTLSTLSKNPVFSSVISEEGWNNHVELGLWADAMVVAPATATTLAKMAQGISDNIITAVYLSARCPVFFAPAMDLDMWQHPATLNNVGQLIKYGNQMIDPTYGELASGLVGQGRMAEPEDIVALLAAFFERQAAVQEQPLKGLKAMVSSGPTYEPIDPVRFIGNRSSGKMGTAVADELARQGAEVTLITGPTKISPKVQGVEIVRIETAEDMYHACVEHFPKMDIAVMAAAVADYAPINVANNKIKKTGDTLILELKKTPDIARELGVLKRQGQFMVGFALETDNELQNAQEKLQKKNFDLIVLNTLKDEGAGFNHDTNKITLINRSFESKSFSLKSKEAVAHDIVQAIVEEMKARLA